MGEQFLRQIGLNRQCVVLTATPNDLDTTAIASVLATALGTRSIFPPADGLATLDGTHLNLESAERWSGLFVQALTPILKDCISG
jgi:hypothetical protein